MDFKIESYKWCPYCGMEEHVESGDELNCIRLGTDGWGQPVRFDRCKCGELYGWFYISHYRNNDSKFKFDQSFKEYLQYRIKFYYTYMLGGNKYENEFPRD